MSILGSHLHIKADKVHVLHELARLLEDNIPLDCNSKEILIDFWVVFELFQENLFLNHQDFCLPECLNIKASVLILQQLDITKIRACFESSYEDSSVDIKSNFSIENEVDKRGMLVYLIDDLVWLEGNLTYIGSERC